MAVPSAQLAQIFAETLAPDNNIRTNAEKLLENAQRTPGHSLQVLQIVANDNNAVPGVRQAAAVHFKNTMKKGWKSSDENDIVITHEDRNTIKSHLVQLMLSTPAEIQAQLSESISLIAAVDYPDNWGNLLDELVQQIHSSDAHVVVGVLKTADSIFRRFRYVQRSDALYRVILYTLKGIQAELLTLFKKLGGALEASANDAKATRLILETLCLACSIHYSLNYQDLPEFVEDHIGEFMREFSKFLQYNNPLAVDDDEELEPGPIDKLQAGVVDILMLYASKDEECIQEHLPTFTSLIWNRLIGLTPYPKHDSLATSSILYIKELMNKPMHRAIFETEGTLDQIITRIVIPNLTIREADEERFEDDPREFIVTEVEGSDSETRRKCSQDLLNVMCRQFEQNATAICQAQIQAMLNQYAQNPMQNWKAKDTAIHLMMGIAVKRQSEQGGVTEVNGAVDVLDFFQKQILPELQDGNHTVRPVIKATALKFVSVFRNQFTAEQLKQLIPMVASHLSSPVVVVHTFAAYVLERMIMTKEDPNDFSNKSVRKLHDTDVQPYLSALLTGLFTIIDNESLNENDHAMKCVMRCLATAGQGVVPMTQLVIEKLTAVLIRVAKNPRNPHFNHCVFESIAVLIKNVCEQHPDATASFEPLLFPPFTNILQQEIVEFTPYVFQILAQLLEYRPASAGLGEAYTGLFSPLLAPNVWEKKGDVPAVCRLIQAYICKAAPELASSLERILGVFQKLNASKWSGSYAFDILNAITVHFRQDQLTPYLPTIVNLILCSISDKLISTQKYKGFATTYFALIAGKYGAQVLFSILNQMQDGLPVTFLSQVWLPTLQDNPPSQPIQAKTMAIGLTRILCESSSDLLSNGKGQEVWGGLLKGVVSILSSPVITAVKSSSESVVDDSISTGFDAKYSKLIYASKKAEDPFSEISDPVGTFTQSFHGLVTSQKEQILPFLTKVLSTDEKVSNGLGGMFEKAGLSLS